MISTRSLCNAALGVAAAALLSAAAHTASAQYVPTVVYRPVIAPVPVPQPVVVARPVYTTSYYAPTTAYYAPVAAPAVASTVVYQPTTRVITRRRPILGGTVTRYRPGPAVPVVYSAPVVVGY
ncbi:MAG: hypothetical protein AAGA92_07245 [Planctomycetota bacterium]